MNLDQLIGVKPIECAANKDFEEKRITKQDKGDLDKTIAKELKQGWQVKARSHEAEGVHGVTLIRRKGPIESQTLLDSAANSHHGSQQRESTQTAS